MNQLAKNNVGIWTLRLIIGLVFLLISYNKIAGDGEGIFKFATQQGGGTWFQFVIAPIEILGAIAVLIPRATRIGCLILLFAEAGADLGLAHLFPNNGLWNFATLLLFGPLLVWLFAVAKPEDRSPTSV